MSLADLSPLANHLWQSTLFVAVIGLLALSLKHNRAQVRYWLWLAASMKFVIPFDAFVGIGRQVGWQSSTSITQTEITFFIDTITQPFSGPALVPMSSPTAVSTAWSALPFVLSVVWFCGCAMHSLVWWIGWRRLGAVVQEALPLEDGREVNALWT